MIKLKTIAGATALYSFLSISCLGQTLHWNPNDGSEGGNGEWNTDALNWRQDESAQQGWQNDATALFAGVSGAVIVGDNIQAEALQFEVEGYSVELNNFGGFLRTKELSGNPTIWFGGNVGSGANLYPNFLQQLQRGLILTPDGETTLSARLESLQGGSPFISVRGDGAVVNFDGSWIADTGSIYSWLVPVGGGTFRIKAESEFRFIKDAYYTLQLWVQGDGTGTLEIEEGFQADRTANASIPRGIGAIRLSSTTFITHHSRNLPMGYRPKSAEAIQANGHLVFENAGNSKWIIRSNDQVYPGALWIYRDVEIHTEQSLTHTGVTELNSDYTAWNGLSVFGATITKTGPASLRLAGEQAYDDGSFIQVLEGGVDFITDPSGGQKLNGGTKIGTVMLYIAPEASAHFHASARIGAILADGKVTIGRSLTVMQQPESPLFVESSTTSLTLQAGVDSALIDVPMSAAVVAGKLRIWRDPSFFPVPGTRIDLLSAGSVSNAWELEDFSGLGLELHHDDTHVWVVTTQSAKDIAGEVVLEDDFDNLNQWKDLSEVPLWGQPLRHQSAFQINNSAVQLTRSGVNDTRSFTSYSSSVGLKTFTALDFQLPQEVNRRDKTLTLDAFMRWDATTESTGESGRFIFAFNYAYPEGGLNLIPEGQEGSKLNDQSEAWWARPAYHLRLRNSTTRAGSSFLQYGGGHSDLGEYEATANWWLPGFISGAGAVAPGNGDDFPVNSWSRTFDGIASDTFILYRYVLHPDRQEVWRDDNQNGLFEPEELKAVMQLPETSAAPLYRYHEMIEGVRLFWNGGSEGGVSGDAGQVYVDWVRLTINANQAPVAGAIVPDIALITNGVDGTVIVDASSSTDPENDPMLFQWYQGDTLLVSSESPVTAFRLPVGNKELTLKILDSAGNLVSETYSLIVTPGNLRPIAQPGSNQSHIANERLLAAVTLNASGSFDPDGSIVNYQWTRNGGSVVVYSGPEAIVQTALGLGTHILTLTVTDDNGATGTANLRVEVITPSNGPSQVIYRENFSRVTSSTEMGPWMVGWNLMRYDGEPVASVSWDGNAHRSLTSSSPAPYTTKVNANPTGLEYDAPNARGHMWMNQMPFLNATPSEWMLWTSEYTIDQSQHEITTIQFHSTDSSPERVKVSLAARIEGQWYIHWDGRVETQWNTWRQYTINFSQTGWYRFVPSAAFTVRQAAPINLPSGVIEAFGLYMFKDYGWYVNQIDNFTINAREREVPPPYLSWQLANFSPVDLIDPAKEATIWGDHADPDGDGFANLLEFALGGDPNLYNTFAKLNLELPGYLQLVISRNPLASEVQLQVQHSNDLQNWTDVDAQWDFLGEDSEVELWNVTVEDTGEAAQFYRIAAVR